MRKASTRLLEQGIQAPSPAPDLIPAENKTSTENLHWDWYSKRGHFTCMSRRTHTEAQMIGALNQVEARSRRVRSNMTRRVRTAVWDTDLRKEFAAQAGSFYGTELGQEASKRRPVAPDPIPAHRRWDKRRLSYSLRERKQGEQVHHSHSFIYTLLLG